MNKISLERINDGFLNFNIEGIFVKTYEHTSVIISEMKGYKLYPNIDKKNGVIHLECSFPLNNFDEINKELENKGYNIRVTDNKGKLDMTMGNIKIERIEDSLIKIKKQLTRFSYGNLG